MQLSYGEYLKEQRAKRRSQLLALSVTPARRERAFRIETELIAIPDWAQRRAVRHFKAGPGYVWLKRSDAAVLMRLDKEAGGHPRSIEMEYRICPVCREVSVNEDAAARRQLDESFFGRMKPCGLYCLERSKERA
jgi:hypothetical protein